MRIAALLALVLATTVHAQWTMQRSNTTADLRGIHNVGNGVAWASGTHGTVLRTEDGGYLWQTCTVPPGAEKLDFRGIQAFDANTAIVMSSGSGNQSRLYKTTDGCATWKLVFTNPDKDGFWDAVTARMTSGDDVEGCGKGSRVIRGAILGDPAIHKLNQWDTTKRSSFYLADFVIGITCPTDKLSRSASALFSTSRAESAFAASNSVLYEQGPGDYWIVTAYRMTQYITGATMPSHYYAESLCDISIPIGRFSESVPELTAGAFSLGIRPGTAELPKPIKIGGFNWKAPTCLKADMVVVGGDYKAVDDVENTAAFTAGSNKFQLAKTMPHGYRSAVAYEEKSKTWITVGPNGTDISTDDGRNWRALKPISTDAPDADKNWNALSLPYVVGPKGRIAKLREDALKP
ncbi:MAG TPA: hypothetical protein VGB94_10725 [Acidobacteriaceae bacterium]